MEECSDAAKLVKGGGRKEMKCFSSRESFSLSSMGLRFHELWRDPCISRLAQVPWKVKFLKSRGVEAAELLLLRIFVCLFLFCLLFFLGSVLFF